MGFDLATVGDNCIDRYLPPVGLSCVGGNAVNVAVHLARAGNRTAYFGAVGDDAAGQRVAHGLGANRLDLAGLRILPGATTAHTDIATHADGEREMVFEDFGACRGYHPGAEDLAVLRRKRHVHIGWLDDGGALKAQLALAGIGLSQDLGVNADPRHLVADALSIAFASAGPSAEAASALLQSALAAGAGIAVVTCGRLGSRASDGRQTVAVEALPVEVTDTTGAGDSFIAGFIDAHLHGRDLAACLAAGRDLAALTCGHFGGFPQIAGDLP